jgi:hypothetical protein
LALKQSRGSIFGLKAVFEALQSAAGKLTGKKSADEYGECNEVPSQMQENPAGDSKRHGDMNRQNPLGRKSANPRSPIAEGHINQKD